MKHNQSQSVAPVQEAQPSKKANKKKWELERGVGNPKDCSAVAQFPLIGERGDMVCQPANLYGRSPLYYNLQLTSLVTSYTYYIQH